MNCASLYSMIYLDYNATTPIDQRVCRALSAAYAENFGNPSSRDHKFGWDSAEAVEDARSQVSNLINAKPGEIIFTSCATESVNLALKGIAQSRGSQGTTIISSVIEHKAVLETSRQLERLAGIRVKLLPADRAE